MKYTFTQLIPGIDFDFLICSLATMFLMVVGSSAQKGAELPMKKVHMKQISVEGINISYVEKGEGNPLVFVHGSPTSSFLWRDMIDELSVHGRVIALSPGFQIRSSIDTTCLKEILKN